MTKADGCNADDVGEARIQGNSMHGQYSLCRVCGFDLGEDFPWGPDGRTCSFNICPCCGVEFGYEDATPEGILKFRAEWFATGGLFRDKSQRPPGWSRVMQLQRIGVADVHLS